MGQNQLPRANELLQRATQCDSPMKLHAQRAYEALLAKKAAMVWQHKRHSVDGKGLASTVLKAAQTYRMMDCADSLDTNETSAAVVDQSSPGVSIVDDKRQQLSVAHAVTAAKPPVAAPMSVSAAAVASVPASSIGQTSRICAGCETQAGNKRFCKECGTKNVWFSASKGAGGRTEKGGRGGSRAGKDCKKTSTPTAQLSTVEPAGMESIHLSSAECPDCGTLGFQTKFCRECGVKNEWFKWPLRAVAVARVTHSHSLHPAPCALVLFDSLTP